MKKTRFTYPARALSAAPLSVISPSRSVVQALAPPQRPPTFKVQVAPGGGFTIRLGRGTYPLETWVSYPQGEFNWLAAARKPTHKQEQSWSVKTRRISEGEYAVAARGKSYTIKRRILIRPDHVMVKDTYTNSTKEDLGLLIYNHLYTKGKNFETFYTAGYESMGRKDDNACPTVFGAGKRVGFGLLPLDDVLIVQSVCYTEPEFVGVGTEKFALGAKKSYTVEWAVYPNRTGDFYDFINAVRRNEDRIGTIDGGFAFISKGMFNRRNIPTKKYLDLTNIKYGAIHCLSGAADDPKVSIEGVEFMDFPREKALLRKQMDEIHRKHPNLKVVVHVAHSLYATDKPDRFADSKVIEADGKQPVWSRDRTYMEGYFSKERLDEGWDWWIFYPTPGNSFHDALMKSVEVLMDEIGADGFFMDGFMWGYCGRWTYDRWDGHSAEIDKKTHTVKRKMASVLLLSQPSLIRLARKIRDKGGVIVANNSVLTRTITREKYIIHDIEVHPAPFLQLAPSCTALANPSAIKKEKDVYLDALDKLKWGLLFFYYEEGRISYPSLPSKMFPMTFEEIRSGMVRGPERIVTMIPGVHGWRGEPNLHIVHRFDSRGGHAAYDVLTTSDKKGVRSYLKLKKHESAVVEKLPIVLRSDRAVNLTAQRYDAKAIRLTLNGKGKATLRIETGAFEITPGATYRVRGGDQKQAKADAKGVLSVPLTLDGQVEVEIGKGR